MQLYFDKFIVKLIETHMGLTQEEISATDSRLRLSDWKSFV